MVVLIKWFLAVLEVPLRAFCKGFRQKAVAVRPPCCLYGWTVVVRLLVSLWGFSFPNALLVIQLAIGRCRFFVLSGTPGQWPVLWVNPVVYLPVGQR